MLNTLPFNWQIANGKSQMDDGTSQMNQRQMTTDRLTIRKQGNPTRCEVCHQADQFDPPTGICRRCKPVFQPNPFPPPTSTESIPSTRISPFQQVLEVVWWFATVNTVAWVLCWFAVYQKYSGRWEPKAVLIGFEQVWLVSALIAFVCLRLAPSVIPFAQPLGRHILSVLLLGAILVPGFLLIVQAREFGYHRMQEASAQETLRKVNSAQVTYSLGIGKGNYTSDLRVLGGSSSTDIGFLDDTVTAAQTTPKSGYLLGPIHATPATESTASTYSVIAFSANSKGVTRTGNDCYYVDDTGVIRHSSRPDVWPDSNSPPIQ